MLYLVGAQGGYFEKMTAQRPLIKPTGGPTLLGVALADGARGSSFLSQPVVAPLTVNLGPPLGCAMRCALRN